MSEMVVGSHLGHKVNKFKIFVDRRKSASKCSTLDMRRTDFRLIRGLVSKVPGESFWRCWVSSALITFEHHLLRAEDQAIPKCQKSSR